MQEFHKLLHEYRRLNDSKKWTELNARRLRHLHRHSSSPHSTSRRSSQSEVDLWKLFKSLSKRLVPTGMSSGMSASKSSSAIFGGRLARGASDLFGRMRSGSRYNSPDKIESAGGSPLKFYQHSMMPKNPGTLDAIRCGTKLQIQSARMLEKCAGDAWNYSSACEKSVYRALALPMGNTTCKCIHNASRH